MAVLYEVSKYRLTPDNLFPSIESMLERLPDLTADNPPCSGDLLCLREGKRHKRDCPGKTVPIGQYMRGIR